MLIYFSAKNNERLINNLTLDLNQHFTEILIATKVQMHAEQLLREQNRDEKVIEALEVLERARLAALDIIEEARHLAIIKLKTTTPVDFKLD
jgi:hypothetical protein